MIHATHKTPAYSLVFAFLIMTVIMLVAGTTIENTQDKVTYFREIEGTAQARLAAESAAELAVMEIRDAELGFDPAYSDTTAGEGVFCLEYGSATSTTTTTSTTGNPEDDCKTWASYDVRSVAEENTADSSGSGYFYTPIPGTGSAGLSDECSILDSHLDPDHPCNWNKLMYGQSVTVPLYVDDGIDYSGATYTPASAEIDLDDWYLKVRTPCVDEYSETCTRYEFEGESFVPYAYHDANGDGMYTPSLDNPSVILWQLIGENATTGAISTVVPDDDTDVYTPTLVDTYRTSTNTEISQSDINSDEIVLELSTHTDIEEISTDSSGTYNLTSLVLQLDIVSLLVDSDGDSIPYLEWQFVTLANYPFATNEMSVIGSGYYEGESGTFYFPYVISRSSTGESTNIYTLSN